MTDNDNSSESIPEIDAEMAQNDTNSNGESLDQKTKIKIEPENPVKSECNVKIETETSITYSEVKSEATVKQETGDQKIKMETDETTYTKQDQVDNENSSKNNVKLENTSNDPEITADKLENTSNNTEMTADEPKNDKTSTGTSKDIVINPLKRKNRRPRTRSKRLKVLSPGGPGQVTRRAQPKNSMAHVANVESPSVAVEVGKDTSTSDDVEYCLTVTNLPNNWSFMDIKNYIDTQCGPVDEMEMFKDEKTGNGAIRLSYPTEDECKRAMEKLKDNDLEGTKLAVEMNVINLVSDSEIHSDTNTEVVANQRPWRPDLDVWELDPEGMYGLKESFLKSIGITPPLDRWVHVSNFRCDKTELRDVMEVAGHVLMCCIFQVTPRYANVMYSHPLEAVQAVSMFNGQMFYGQPIKVAMDRSPSETVLLPKGLNKIGAGLGVKGKPLRNVVEHYKRYTTNKSSLVDTSVFKEYENSNLNQEDVQFVVKNVENFNYVLPKTDSTAKSTASVTTVTNPETVTKPVTVTQPVTVTKPVTVANPVTVTQSATVTQTVTSVKPSTTPPAPTIVKKVRPTTVTTSVASPSTRPLIASRPSQPHNFQPPRNVQPYGPNFHPRPGFGPGPRPFGPDPRMRPGPGWNGPRPMGPMRGPMGPGPMQGPGPMRGPMSGQMGGPMGGPMPGQMGGPMPGQMGGPMPGQMGGPMPGQMGGPMPGQMGGPMPGQMGGQMPGQMGGPMPGQMGGPMPGQMGGLMSGPMQGPMPGPMFPNPNEPQQVQLMNLPPSTTFTILCEKMAQCGQVVSIQLTTPGCAVVTFGNRMQADRCFQKFIMGIASTAT